jgi:hypothetical protein
VDDLVGVDAAPAGFTTATTPSPKSGCGTPIAADSSTRRAMMWSRSPTRMTLKPPEMIRSWRGRSEDVAALVDRPTSPVMKNPSGQLALVFSGICQ